MTRADTSDLGLSLNQQVQYGAITDGIALVLSAGVGVIGEAIDKSRGKPFKLRRASFKGEGGGRNFATRRGTE